MTEKKVSLQVLADLVKGEIVGDNDIQIHGFASIETAGQGEITFLVKANRLDTLAATKASAVLVPMAIKTADTALIRVKDPYLASAKIHNFLLYEPFIPKGIHGTVCIGTNCEIADQVSIAPHVVIGDRVKLGQRITIEAGTVIGDDVEIGDDTILKANVTVEHGSCIGRRVIIHPGTVIGSEGYGYAADENGCHIKRPQVGIVRIDDDVEIGSNTCVDRATYGVTWIKSGAKIDNLIQIGHNVVVGENSLLVAQVGLAGSTTLGRNVVLGGKVGVKGHVHLDDGAMVAAGSGVHQNLGKGAVVGGIPAIPVRQWAKSVAVYARLPEMAKDVTQLKKDIEALKKESE